MACLPLTGVLAGFCLGLITGMAMPDWSEIARDDFVPLAGPSSRLLWLTAKDRLSAVPYGDILDGDIFLVN